MGRRSARQNSPVSRFLAMSWLGTALGMAWRTYRRVMQQSCNQRSHQVTSDSQGNERHGHFYEPTQPPGHIRLTRKWKTWAFLWANTATRSHQTHKEIKGAAIFMSQHSHQVTSDSQGNQRCGHFYEPTQPPGHIRLTQKWKPWAFLRANTATRSH